MPVTSLKSSTGFKLNRDQMEKINSLQNKRGTSKSETLRFIVDEFFSTGSQRQIVDELERIKIQINELNYKLQETTQRLIKQNKEMMTVLLVLCGQDDRLVNDVKNKLPHLVRKKS